MDLKLHLFAGFDHLLDGFNFLLLQVFLLIGVLQFVEEFVEVDRPTAAGARLPPPPRYAPRKLPPGASACA
jgi:hypothetical protein